MSTKFAFFLMFLWLLPTFKADGGRNRKEEGSMAARRDSALVECVAKANEMHEKIKGLANLAGQLRDICPRGPGNANSIVGPVDNLMACLLGAGSPKPFPVSTLPIYSSSSAPCECPPCPYSSSSPVFFVLSLVFFVGFILSTTALAVMTFLFYKRK